jgi:hypothetical protein
MVQEQVNHYYRRQDRSPAMTLVIPKFPGVTWKQKKQGIEQLFLENLVIHVHFEGRKKHQNAQRAAQLHTGESTHTTCITLTVIPFHLTCCLLGTYLS